MLKKLSERLRAKFPPTTPGNSMVKNCPSRDDAFLEVFELQESSLESQSLHAAKRKEKGKKESRKNQKA